ncbi:putative hydrolase YuaR [Colletotrichum chlorophyti]|uniref:Putative hydrolase YuaR n=1 Tax=Colletotrichum chlorophyti TaxID=708187 RepID=A0A1Q8RTK3_9PEZI|nr:putative hydrolase YuaR [Colletotrichum chlorophyti]
MEKGRMSAHRLPANPHSKPRGWRKAISTIALISVASLYVHQYCWRSGNRDGRGVEHTPNPVKDPPFGKFPLPRDPFRFIPCTNATIPPSLDDYHSEETWAALYDPDPSNWSWGNKTTTAFTNGDSDPYAGRGIYLCGYLEVPLDYTNSSDARIVRLAVTKYQVSGLARVGEPLVGYRNPPPGGKSERTIVIEPGGPGGSGTSYVWRSAELFTERFSDGEFDVLGWDPRGVNTTRPSIACFPYDVDRDRWFLLTGQYLEVSDPVRQLNIADAMNNATFKACWETIGDLGRFVGTALVARDLEEIRKALDEDELTGYLVSYGTGIGQTYANIFPESVGRMILDGTEYVRDHRLVGGFGWTALDNATDAWYDGFLGECINAGPEHCALARSGDGKPVVLKDLDKRMTSLLRALIDRPMSGYNIESGPSLVTYSVLVEAIYASLYNARSWPALAQMLYELEEGNSTLATAFLETSAWEYDPSLPTTLNKRPSSDELGSLVICADAYDAPMPPGGLAWWGSLWANMTTKSWVSGNSRFFSVFPCRHFTTYWPEPAGVWRGDLNHTLKHPILLIAETYDPATPLRNGRRLLNEMGRNARLIAHHGYGHSSRDTSNCTDSIAKRYILEGVLPEESETACYADEKPYLYGVKDKSARITAGQGWDPVAAWRENMRS